MKPNILLIMADQMRWDAWGRMGGSMKTPVLDQLSEEGVTFTNCITNSPVCAPTRISLATGQYPHNTGVWRNLGGYDLPADTPTFMQSIRNEGYRTAIIGKAHLHHHSGDLRARELHMNQLGFDDVNEITGPRASSKAITNMTLEWQENGVLDAYIEDFRERFNNKPYVARPSTLPLHLYYDVYVGQQAKTYLQQYSDDKPWFVQVGFAGPHEPWDAPEPYASMYHPGDMPAAIDRNMFNDAPNRPQGYLDKLMFHDKMHSPPMSKDEIASMRANYAGNVTLIDEQIGEIIQVLKDRNQYDQTVIVFVSDHGEMNGDFGLIYKENFFNSAVKVPLIIKTPEMIDTTTQGTSYDEMVEFFDIGPTLVECAGGVTSYQHFAKSLGQAIARPNIVHREEALSEVRGEVMLSNKEWKIVFNQQGAPYLLFDLIHDPLELTNLVNDSHYKHVIDDFRIRLCQRLISTQRYIFHDRPDSAGIEHLVGRH